MNRKLKIDSANGAKSMVDVDGRLVPSHVDRIYEAKARIAAGIGLINTVIKMAAESQHNPTADFEKREERRKELAEELNKEFGPTADALYHTFLSRIDIKRKPAIVLPFPDLREGLDALWISAPDWLIQYGDSFEAEVGSARQHCEELWNQVKDAEVCEGNRKLRQQYESEVAHFAFLRLRPLIEVWEESVSARNWSREKITRQRGNWRCLNDLDSMREYIERKLRDAIDNRVPTTECPRWKQIEKALQIALAVRDGAKRVRLYPSLDPDVDAKAPISRKHMAKLFGKEKKTLSNHLSAEKLECKPIGKIDLDEHVYNYYDLRELLRDDWKVRVPDTYEEALRILFMEDPSIGKTELVLRPVAQPPSPNFYKAADSDLPAAGGQPDIGTVQDQNAD